MTTEKTKKTTGRQPAPPTLQRLPPRTDEARELRDALTPEPVLGDVDWAGLELRVLASLLVFALAVLSEGCAYRLGPYVRDARVLDGAIQVRECEVVLDGYSIPVFGASYQLHEDRCTTRTLDGEWRPR